MKSRFTCQKCLTSESDLLVHGGGGGGGGVLCLTSRDGRTLITAAFNSPCLAQGKRQ